MCPDETFEIVVNGSGKCDFDKQFNCINKLSTDMRQAVSMIPKCIVHSVLKNLVLRKCGKFLFD